MARIDRFNYPQDLRDIPALHCIDIGSISDLKKVRRDLVDWSRVSPRDYVDRVRWQRSVVVIDKELKRLESI